MVGVDPYMPKALMRFTSSLSLNGLSTMIDTLIDTATTPNFVSKKFVLASGFFKDCKVARKLAIRVASKQRIYTTNVFFPSVFIIDGHEFIDLQFRVLPHFKSSDIILGSLTLKQLGVVMHPSMNTFTMGNIAMNCNRESHRIS